MAGIRMVNSFRLGMGPRAATGGAPADVTAPTLSSPTGTQTGATTGTSTVSTNEANGTLYSFLSLSSSPPTAANLKTGTGAVTSASQAVSATGVQTVNWTGLTASTTYYTHWLHRDAAGNDSAIVSGAGFTTTAVSGLDPSISAPVLTLATANLTYPPQLDAVLDDTAQVGDSLHLQRLDLALSVTHDYAAHVITSGEGTAKAATLTVTEASGTNRYRLRVERGSSYSAWSNTVIQGPDDVAPVLSSASVSMVSATSGLFTVTTDTAEGTLYHVLTATNSAPSKAQVKAGQTSAGAAASYAGSQAVTTIGVKTKTGTGLTASTAYYGWSMHEDVAGNQSTVASHGTFTTDVAAAFSMVQTAAPATQNLGFGSANATFTSASFGAADTSRKILIDLVMYNGGGAVTSVTVGGIAATLVLARNGSFEGWEAAVPTGTSGNVVVSTGSNISWCSITVTSIIGSNTRTVHTALAHGFNNSPQSISVTTPAGGATHIAAEVDVLTGTSAWTNATKQSQDSSFGATLDAAIRSTSGAATVQLSGHGNQNSCANAVSYGP